MSLPTPTAGTLPARRPYLHDGRTVYTWEQGVETVSIFLSPPPGVTGAHFAITLSPRVVVGLKGAPPFLDLAPGGAIVPKECTWTLSDGELEIVLVKAARGAAWPAAFAGHEGQTTAAVAEDTARRLLLERFQLENPGFDFSGAAINGAVPDARTFMGGMR